MDSDQRDNSREPKTVRFDPELQVVFVDTYNVPERLHGQSTLQPLVRQRVAEYQSDAMRRSRPRRQSRLPALPPRNHTDVLAQIAELLEQPLEPSPPSTPPADTPSTPPPSPSSPPPPLQPKPQPQPQPRAKHPLSITGRGVQRYRRDTATVGRLSGSGALAAGRGNAAPPSRFFQTASMHPHVPPIVPPPLPAQPSTSIAAVDVAATVIVPGQNVHGKKGGESESGKGGGVNGHDKGRCKKRDDRCKKCDRAANQPRSDGDNDDGDNRYNGCGMECLQFALQCTGCTII